MTMQKRGRMRVVMRVTVSKQEYKMYPGLKLRVLYTLHCVNLFTGSSVATSQ